MWDFEWWRHPPTKDGALPIVMWALTFTALWLLGMEVVYAALCAVGAMAVTSVIVLLVRRFTGDE